MQWGCVSVHFAMLDAVGTCALHYIHAYHIFMETQMIKYNADFDATPIQFQDANAAQIGV